MTTQASLRSNPKVELLEAAKRVLLEDGYAGLSTRAVAAEAGTQMSQIRYHFGSKEGMVLALFEHMNEALIARQAETFHRPDLTVSQKWSRACDYLEEDLESGYVRVLQELTAVGWSNPAVGDAIRRAVAQWQSLILELVREVEGQIGSLGPFRAEEIATLIGAAFVGAESLILLGFDDTQHPMRAALRNVGDLIGMTEARKET
ncbi:TetR/AcrR family transcriptional regulator [Silicimonas algicola]|uniref:TetR family transcriptional regulator n=1 Tax=Silicimonas algicola TaxID=1826607 RepID=A0A316GRH2_9RHOB|nr:TetR/AcrR family transcriptional regulator [Silicimonas algicola]PWK57607.1 TetR family transcriptional regulator [Silicimonas algicola]